MRVRSLSYQHAMRMRRIILPSVACMAPQYFPTLCKKDTIWGGGEIIEHKMFLFFSKLFSELFLVLGRSERDTITNSHRALREVLDIIVRVEWNSNFLGIFWKNTQISNFVKIRPVGAELFHADGRTDTTKLIVAFRNFVNTSKTMVKFSYFVYWQLLLTLQRAMLTAIA